VSRVLPILLLLFCASAQGAGIAFVEPDTIAWSGEFNLAGYDEFIRLSEQHPGFATLRLSGTGDGDPAVTRWMIWTARGPGMTVVADGPCAGACALIFLNASKRLFPRPPSARTYLHLKGPHDGRTSALVDDIKEAARLATEVSASTGGKLSLRLAFTALRAPDPRGGLLIYAVPAKIKSGSAQVFSCKGDEPVRPGACTPVLGATPLSLGIVSAAQH
jgi:hypothetical protein